MKHVAFQFMNRFLSIFAYCAFTPAIIAQAGIAERFNVDTIYHVTTGPGIQTTAIRLSETSGTMVTNVFYTSVDLDNPDLTLRGVQALDQEGGSESVLNMGKRKNTASGIQYIAGVNGDHANLNGAYKRTNGASVIDGKYYNHGVGDNNWKQFGSYVAVEGAKDVTITGSLSVKLPLRFPNGQEHHLHINSQRDADYLVLYTPEHGTSTKTNVWGRECQIKLVSGSIIDGDAVFEVTSEWVGDLSGNASHGNMAIPSDGYVLSGNGSGFNLIGTLKPGDRLKMDGFTPIIDGREAKSDNIVGGCPIIVSDGEAITPAECSELYKATLVQTTPTARTAIGISEKKHKIYMVVADYYQKNECTSGDKANYGAKSSGLDFVSLAEFMIYLDCENATAMDGGGSSQLYNRMTGICNIPYGLSSYLRPVANGFFAAVSTPDDDEIAYLEVVQKNVRLNSGESFTPKVYGYNRYGLLVDTDVKGFSLSVNSTLGTVEGNKFRAGGAKASTTGIINLGAIRCGVNIATNGGGDFISSGSNAATEIMPPYLDNPAGIADISVQQPAGERIVYNLQGQRTDGSGKGLQIERCGNDVKKIIR